MGRLGQLLRRLWRRQEAQGRRLRERVGWQLGWRPRMWVSRLRQQGRLLGRQLARQVRQRRLQRRWLGRQQVVRCWHEEGRRRRHLQRQAMLW